MSTAGATRPGTTEPSTSTTTTSTTAAGRPTSRTRCRRTSRAGAYAARLSCGEHEDMIPFFVRPRLGAPGAPICVLVPTFTYTVYGNYSRGLTNDEYRARSRSWGAREHTADDHREYGLSTYNFHRDGSGICYASRLRPVLNLRSGFLSYVDARGSGLRHYPADTHLLDWLEESGYRFDVVTDEDLHREGPRPHRPLPGSAHHLPPGVPHRPHPRRPGTLSRRGRTPDVSRRKRLLLAGRAARRRPGRGRDPARGRAGSAPGRRSPGSTTTRSTASTGACGGATTARRSALPGWGSRGRGSSSARTTSAPPEPTTRARRGSSRACRIGSSATSA